MSAATSCTSHASISAAVIRITMFFGRSDYDYFFDAPQPDPAVLPLSNWNPVTNTAPVMLTRPARSGWR